MGLALLVAVAVAVIAAFLAFHALVWRPYDIARKLRAQGLSGPGYRFFVGNLDEMKLLRGGAAGATLNVGDHDYMHMALPHFHKWIPLYGRMFVYWLGPRPNLCVADINVVREVLSDRTGRYPKSLILANLARLLGMAGLILSDGDNWKRHHKVVKPAFTAKLKMPTVTMLDCARSMISEWGARLGKLGAVEVELSTQFQELTADVISRTVLGSSYQDGKDILKMLTQLQHLAFSTLSLLDFQLPGFKYIPTKKNIKTSGLDKKVRSMLTDIVKRRLTAKDTAGYGKDLLGLMLEASAPEHGGNPDVLSMDEVVDDCKSFLIAGHDTTAHLLTWASFLLSTHPDWQERLREEVRRECGDDAPPTSSDVLSRLRLVNMFLLETLRLYTPVSLIQRKAGSSLELGGVSVPEGTILTIPIAAIHRDKEVWGEDAGEFKPERFENGVNRAAKHPNALMSFSSGQRSCIGQNFAMTEAKVVVAMILQRFSLELSPKYVHAPMDLITLKPRHGLPMFLKSLKM